MNKPINKYKYFKNRYNFIYQLEKQNPYFYKTSILNFKIYYYFLEKKNSESSYFNKFLNPYYYISNFAYVGNQSNLNWNDFLKNIKDDQIDMYFQKYISHTHSFIFHYELLYRLNKKYIYGDIIEISTNPSFFEVFHYFQNYFQLFPNIHYTTYYTNDSFLYKNESDMHSYMDLIKSEYHPFPNYTFKYTSQWIPLHKKYDFMILNLRKNIHHVGLERNSNKRSTLYYLNSILLQTSYLQNIKVGGSCLFYIHYLIHPETDDIFYHLQSIFHKVEIFGREDLDFRKLYGGVWLYCIHKRDQPIQPNRSEMIKKIYKWNLQQDRKKYIFLKQYWKQLQKPIHNIIDIRKKQMIASYQWTQKYNFPILPIYESYIPSSFDQVYRQYFQINQHSISSSIPSTSHSLSSSQIQNNLFFLHKTLQRYETIYQRILEDISFKKSFELSSYARNFSNLPFYIEQTYQIPFVTYDWIQYFDLFHTLPKFLSKSSLSSLHIHDPTGMSISSLFTFIHSHKKPSFTWNWSFIPTKKKQDIFSIYTDHKDHQIKKIKNKFDLIIINIDQFDIKDIKHILPSLHSHSHLIFQIQFDSIDVPFDQMTDFILELKEHFEKVSMYRSQWALTKNECFIVSSQFTNKKKQISKEKIELSIKKAMIDILTQYQFEIEKSYFIYHSEKKLNSSQHKKISQKMIQRNKNWCKDVGLHSSDISFYNM